MRRTLLTAACALLPVAAAAQQVTDPIIITPLDDDGVLVVPPEEEGTILDDFGNPDDGSLLEPDLDLGFVPAAEEEEPPVVALTGQGALVRALDKQSGRVEDLELASGETATFGKLNVSLGECRYPEDNPSGDAFAYLVLWTEGADRPAFEGWMIASAPALNAMDHARYDVWVLRCKMS